MEKGTENAFGRKSELRLTAGWDGEETFLRELGFTAPFKIMTSFPRKDGGKEVMIMCASPGIMEGDSQWIRIETERGARLAVTSQSYEKIHKMNNGCACRNTIIRIAGNSALRYRPLPVIPFGGSAFESKTAIELEDESSELIYEELLSCGRAACGERFAYRFFHSLSEVSCKGKLIYRENNRFRPASWPMEELGLFEGYTHMAGMLIHMQAVKEKEREIRSLAEEAENAQEVQCGVTRTAAGDLVVRILGRRAETVRKICDEICSCMEYSVPGSE